MTALLALDLLANLGHRSFQGRDWNTRGIRERHPADSSIVELHMEEAAPGFEKRQFRSLGDVGHGLDRHAATCALQAKVSSRVSDRRLRGDCGTANQKSDGARHQSSHLFPPFTDELLEAE